MGNAPAPAVYTTVDPFGMSFVLVNTEQFNWQKILLYSQSKTTSQFSSKKKMQSIYENDITRFIIL